MIDFNYMKRLSADIRIEMVKAFAEIGNGHVGGSASIADVLAVLYGGVMRVDSNNPRWEDRDRLVLSKGHAGPALYATLALKGFFPMDWLMTINKPNTRLPSHCDMNLTPGIDMTTGSLGQGISAAVGIAIANRHFGRDSYTYCIVGDGELNEGQIWEACQVIAHENLSKLILFVDWNKKQLDGYLDQVCKPLNLTEKFEAFGLYTQTVTGYDVESIYTGIINAQKNKDRPSVIILDTYKGIGISFAESLRMNHFFNVDKTMMKEAIDEIERRFANGKYPGGELK